MTEWNLSDHSVRVGGFQNLGGLSASVSFLPSFPSPFPFFYSLHFSRCNSLLPNPTAKIHCKDIISFLIFRQQNKDSKDF